MPPNAARALTRLCSSAGSSSAEVCADGCTNAGGMSSPGLAAISATAPGTVAMCSASWPSDIDFSCGFQPSDASGTRSSTRRVVCASCSSSCSNVSMMAIMLPPFWLLRFGCRAHALEHRLPPGGNALTMSILDESEGEVLEHDQRAAIHFLQSILHVRDRRVRHEQGPVNLEQRRALDALDVTPEMTVVPAEIPEPAATRPRLERHRKRLSVRGFVESAHLGEYRVERVFERRPYEHLVLDREAEIGGGCSQHGHFS